MLLLLDNFEHLLAGVDLLIDVLQAAPSVKLLVTSRERLNVQEEWALALGGLTFPPKEATDPLENFSAVELFIQRARQAQTNFSLDDEAEAVKAICQRVEGMPLGLELAASWLRAMTCQQIAAQMDEQLGLSDDAAAECARTPPQPACDVRAIVAAALCGRTGGLDEADDFPRRLWP